MLLLDSRTRQINGITVFPDSNPGNGQWYFMPTNPHLTTKPDAQLGLEMPQFLLLGYRGQAGTGGFLNFDCNVGASQEQIDEVARTIANEENLAQLPRLAPVPLVGGSVRLLMLGKSSEEPDAATTDGGGTAGPGTEPAGGPGGAGPEFVLKIDHPTSPSLTGLNQASIAVQLDAAGFTVVESCLAGEILPVAVIYSLDYLGLRPAYAIKLSIDWDRVQKHLDESFSAGFFFLSTEIGSAVDELVESRAIVLEADTFVAEGEDSSGVIDRRDAALAQVRNMITDAFFTPSIPPWTPEKKPDWERALDAVAKYAAASTAVAAGGPGAATAASLSFSYKKMDYTRIDKKKLNVNFSERVTVQRSVYPQAHLAGLFKDIPNTPAVRDRLVRTVNIDDDWFQKRSLTVLYRPGLAVDEIDHINVRTDYDGQPKNALLTKQDWSADFQWLSNVENGVFQRDVAVEYEVVFANADVSERPASLRRQEEMTSDQELVVKPEEELFTLRPITVRAENFPWESYSSVEVHLRYTDEANDIRQKDMIRLSAENPDGLWKMFLMDRTRNGYEVRRVFRAMDNHDVDQGWSPADDDEVTVFNPFPTQRVLQIVPALDFSVVKEAFVDVRYEDKANDVRVEESFEFMQGTSSQRFVVDLRDPELTAVHYRVSISFQDGRFIELPESVIKDRRLPVRADMKGRRIITFRPPSDFAARRLRKITVDARFEDFAAGLSFADSFVFESQASLGEFEYDFVDSNRDRFEFRYTILFENGLQQTVDWQSSAETEVITRVP